jgi:hypothetical protein
MGAPEGNSNAAGRKNKPFNAALLRAIAQDDQGDANKLRRAAEQLLTLASQGESWAIKELADRLDGKSIQQVTGTVGITDMTEEELDRRIEQFEQRRKA